MPGRVNVPAGAGKVFPPDWREIGYDDTPISTLIGFDYAVDIKDNWDTSIVTHTERYRDDKVLMYFPKNIDTTNIQTADRMFQASDLEYIDIDLSSARTATAVFTDCSNLRGAIVHGLGNPEAPAGVLNNIANMFSNCKSLVNVDINLTEYSTPISAVNLFTDCWKLKEFEYDGKTENIARITTLYNAFTNCYNLEKLTIRDDLTEWIGCYAAGSYTDAGCLFNVDIGYSNPNNNTQAAFRKAKIAEGSAIKIRKCSNAQDMFREAEIYYDIITNNIFVSAVTNATAINGSYMFMDSKIYKNINSAAFNLDIPSLSNANSLLDGLTFIGGSSTYREVVLNSHTFDNCSNLQRAFANTNIISINEHSQFTPRNYFDLSNATNLTNMFLDSKSFNDYTLDLILESLITATSYAGTKTLQAVGFTDSSVYPLSRFSGLTHWNAFTAAGWSYS